MGFLFELYRELHLFLLSLTAVKKMYPGQCVAMRDELSSF